MEQKIELLETIDYSPLVFKEGDSYDIATRQQRVSNPIAPNMVDIIPDALFDSYSINANTTMPTTIDFFVVPQGGSKTAAQTNMQQSMRLNDPQRMNVTHIGVEFINTIQRDIDGINQNYTLSLTLTDKAFYGPLPISLAPAGVGSVISYGTQVAAATNQAATLGLNRGLQTAWDFRLPQGTNLGIDPKTGQTIFADGLTGVTILQGQTFKATLQAPGAAGYTTADAASGGKGVNLRIYLYGIRTRAVI